MDKIQIEIADYLLTLLAKHHSLEVDQQSYYMTQDRNYSWHQYTIVRDMLIDEGLMKWRDSSNYFLLPTRQGLKASKLGVEQYWKEEETSTQRQFTYLDARNNSGLIKDIQMQKASADFSNNSGELSGISFGNSITDEKLRLVFLITQSTIKDSEKVAIIREFIGMVQASEQGLLMEQDKSDFTSRLGKFAGKIGMDLFSEIIAKIISDQLT